MSIKIVLADDHEIVRSGLRSMLEKQSRIEVIGEAKDGRTTVQLTEKLRPDVVIMDISMPDMNGIDATYQIVSMGLDVKIIALSMHTDREFVAEMLKAGASGYLLKDSAFKELKHAIQTVYEGHVYLSPKIADAVVRDYVGNLSDSNASVFNLLSSREREVLQLLAEGKSTKQIAADLFVSVKTIETHRQNIMKKLNLYNVPDLVKYAIRQGLTHL